MKSTQIHATAIAFGRRGILLRGEPGSGKSTLALRLITEAGYGLGSSARLLRAKLVADDQVILRRVGANIILSPPASLRGLLEVRNLGIMKVPRRLTTMLALVVDLVPPENLERLPEHIDSKVEILGLEMQKMTLNGNDQAGPAKLRAALTGKVASGGWEA
jgi:HPr kinase/phosphorylase